MIRRCMVMLVIGQLCGFRRAKGRGQGETGEGGRSPLADCMKSMATEKPRIAVALSESRRPPSAPPQPPFPAAGASAGSAGSAGTAGPGGGGGCGARTEAGLGWASVEVAGGPAAWRGGPLNQPCDASTGEKGSVELGEGCVALGCDKVEVGGADICWPVSTHSPSSLSSVPESLNPAQEADIICDNAIVRSSELKEEVSGKLWCNSLSL